MSRSAFRCLVCGIVPSWRIARRGDAAATWSCNQHLAVVCNASQRLNEDAELVVRRSVGGR